MNSESVDLIDTDPPFNKSRDFHATPDSLAAGASFQDRWSWERDVQQAWVDQIRDDSPKLMEAIESARYAHSDGMGAFMCFMAVRLLEMKRLLKPTGSIYLHCDPTASHYLKAVMDAVFGWKQFRNEIIWTYGLGGSSKRLFSKKHDILLFYAKTSEYVFHKPLVPATSLMLKGKMKGATDVWPIATINNMARERTGYPTQKPLELYERVIKTSSDEDSVVLDPFAGCATTCIAAEKLHRRWVGIDIWDRTHAVVLARLREAGLVTDDDTSMIASGEVRYETELPERTDDGRIAAPFLKTKTKKLQPEPPGAKMTRFQMYRRLLSEHGPKCQGCDRVFDDPRYLQLDHNTPRSDGGINHISNRVLLCGPCNQAKSNIYTLSGLRRMNKKEGRMADSGVEHPLLREIRAAKAQGTLF